MDTLGATGQTSAGLQAGIISALFPEANRNTVVSGPGLLTALLMVEAGAQGETARQLAAITGVSPENAAAAYRELEETLEGGGVVHAGALWTKLLLRTDFTAALPSVQFGYGISAAELDEWTRKKSLGLIDKFPVEVDASTVVALATALALKMRWIEGLFKPEQTEEGRFQTSEGDASAHFMRSFNAKRYAKRGSTVTADLPTADAVVVRVGLGDEGVSNHDVLADLLSTATPEDVDLTLEMPRFSITSKTDLVPMLKGWGVENLFDDRASDLSGLAETSDPLYVTDAKQTAVVRVDEIGIEAAAVTAMAMAIGSAPPRRRDRVVLRLDRPFGFVVLKGELPLFTGWVANPAQ